MKKFFLRFLILAMLIPAAAWARPTLRIPMASPAVIRRRLVAFLNRTLGWQGFNSVSVLHISRPDRSGLRKVTVLFTKGKQKAKQSYWVTVDGHEIVDNAPQNLAADPWAATRAKLQLQGAPSEGPANAPVTLVEFSDLECPFCKEANQVINQVRAELPGKMRVIFKYYPLTNIHPWAMAAAKAAVCVTAQKSDHFWPFEQTVFSHQDKLDQLPLARVPSRLRDFALESGTQPGPYDACLNSPATTATIQASMRNGKLVGVNSTPTLYIDGREIAGVIPANTLKSLVQYEAKMAPMDDHSHRSFALGAIKGKQCGKCGVLPPLPKKH